MCDEVEESMELYTIKEFHEKMESQYGGVIYSQRMTRIELNNKYKDGIQFVNRSGKSDIIMVNDINAILAEAWYEDRHTICHQVSTVGH